MIHRGRIDGEIEFFLIQLEQVIDRRILLEKHMQGDMKTEMIKQEESSIHELCRDTNDIYERATRWKNIECAEKTTESIIEVLERALECTNFFWCKDTLIASLAYYKNKARDFSPAPSLAPA